MAALTSNQYKAIAHHCEQGYRPELSAFPNYRFTNIKTGEVTTEHITHLEDWYAADRKALSRERARQRKADKAEAENGRYKL